MFNSIGNPFSSCSYPTSQHFNAPSCQLKDTLDALKKATSEPSSPEEITPILTDLLGSLCGKEGSFHINNHNNNFQIKLTFQKIDFEDNWKAIAERLKSFNLSKLENWQMTEQDGTISVQLMTNQSVALLGLNPNYVDPFTKGQKILECISNAIHLAKEPILPLSQLPDTFIAELCTYLPVKDTTSLSMINKRFNSKIGENNYIWENLAKNMGIVVDKNSPLSFKKQIQQLPIEFEEATFDKVNNQLVMKKGINEIKHEFFENFFKQHVPKDQCLNFYMGFGAYQVYYWEGDEMKSARSCSRMDYQYDETEYNEITKKFPKFKIVFVEDLLNQY